MASRPALAESGHLQDSSAEEAAAFPKAKHTSHAPRPRMAETESELKSQINDQKEEHLFQMEKKQTNLKSAMIRA